MDDILMDHHRNRMHRSMAEAFRDEEYACAITVFSGNASKTWRHIEFVLAPFAIGVLFGTLFTIFYRG